MFTHQSHSSSCRSPTPFWCIGGKDERQVKVKKKKKKDYKKPLKKLFVSFGLNKVHPIFVLFCEQVFKDEF